MASAGSLFALGLAARLAASVGPILVIGAEKMSSIACVNRWNAASPCCSATARARRS